MIFPVAPHRELLSQGRDQLRIGQNEQHADQGVQNSIRPHIFSKMHINFKLIQYHWQVFFHPSMASFDETIISAPTGILQ